MVPSHTDASGLRPTGLLVSRRVGVRTGIGTYINYLLGATILAATAVGASLARGSAPAERSERESAPRGGLAKPTEPDVTTTAPPPAEEKDR